MALQDLAGVGVYLAERDCLESPGSFQTKREHARAAEQVQNPKHRKHSARVFWSCWGNQLIAQHHRVPPSIVLDNTNKIGRVAINVVHLKLHEWVIG